MTISDEIRLNIMRILADEPSISQRMLAERLGVSLGKANYCMRALVDKGWVKVTNFTKNPKKSNYLYLLTPWGIEKKAELTAQYLKLKMVEYDSLSEEIERLYREVHGEDQNESESSRRP